jgi:cytidylate kinase
VHQVITISASYGAGGSVIGPAVAKRLGLPFLNRAVPSQDPDAQHEPPSEQATEDERDEGLLERMMSAFASVPDFTSGWLPPDVPDRVVAVRKRAEEVVARFAVTGGVILGWGATVLVDGAFHVRLDGPADRRLRQAMGIEGINESTARGRLEETDRLRARYMRKLYNRDWNDLSMYHLVLNTTAMPLGRSAEVLAAAASAFAGNLS